MPHNFEAAGDIANWPRNEPGKPTQAAVFGVYRPDKGTTCEVLWSGSFPDLEPAIYWAAKKEVEAVRKGKWWMASRCVWQHGLSVEEAVAAIRKQMEPQVKAAIAGLSAGGDFDLGKGPLREVKPGEAKSYYVEIAPKDDDDADPLASWVLPNDPRVP